MMLRITIIIFVVLSWYACKHDCPEGYDCIDKSCICPEDKFEGFGMCRTLGANEYYATVDCLFQDTIFLTFLERQKDFYKVQFDEKDDLVLGLITYKEFPEYDSLYYSNDFVGSGFLGQRDYENNKKVYAQIFGRLTSDGFTGRIDWKKTNTREIVASCPFEMKR